MARRTDLRPIEETRKPNGQFSSEYMHRFRQHQAGLASARARAHTGYAPLIAAGRIHSHRRKLIGLLSKLSILGIECECMAKLLKLLLDEQRAKSKTSVVGMLSVADRHR